MDTINRGRGGPRQKILCAGAPRRWPLDRLKFEFKRKPEDNQFKGAQVSVAVSTYAVPSAQSASRCPVPGRVRHHLVYPQYGFSLGRSFCGGDINTTIPMPLEGSYQGYAVSPARTPKSWARTIGLREYKVGVTKTN